MRFVVAASLKASSCRIAGARTPPCPALTSGRQKAVPQPDDTAKVSPMVRSRIRWTLVAALAVHAGLYAWTRRIQPSTKLFSASETQATELEVAVETAIVAESLPTPASAIDDPIEPSPSPTRVERAPSHATPTSVSSQDRVGGREEVVVAAPDPAASSGSGWTFSPIRPGGPPAAPGGALDSDAFERATHAGVTAAVIQAAKEDEARARKRAIPLFTKHDLELGFAPGAYLAPLSSNHVRRSNAPESGHAVFEFRTDSAGIVASVRVVEASSGHSEWNEVASAIAADARSRPLHVPSGARGLVVTVHVTSSMKTVSGESLGGGTISKIGRALNNPLDTIVDSRTPAQRVVASRIIAVDVL
jgi:hypothetical protein